MVVVFAAAKSSSGDCTSVYRSDKTVKVGSQAIQTELTKDKREQQKGLSGRECIGGHQGMLFVYNRPGQYAFWMKDMKFPIDIVWVGADKKVVAIEKRVSPSTYPEGFVNEKSRPAQYVLELKSGKVDELGIGLGAPVGL